jgi:hypothetical protein
MAVVDLWVGIATGSYVGLGAAAAVDGVVGRITRYATGNMNLNKAIMLGNLAKADDLYLLGDWRALRCIDYDTRLKRA